MPLKAGMTYCILRTPACQEFQLSSWMSHPSPDKPLVGITRKSWAKGPAKSCVSRADFHGLLPQGLQLLRLGPGVFDEADHLFLLPRHRSSSHLSERAGKIANLTRVR